MTSNITHTQIAIIGGGISGLCTAYFLLKAGFEVTIFEQHDNVAEEGTLANSGLLASASLSPLSMPGIFNNAFSSRFNATPAVLPTNPFSFSRWTWQKKNRQHIKNDFTSLKESLTTLSSLGARLITEIQEQHALEQENTQGVFKILHKPDEVKNFEQTEAFLKEHDFTANAVEAAQITAMEPAFLPKASFAKAHYYPDDGAGNCVLFAKQLKQLIHNLGGQIIFGQQVQKIDISVNGEKTIHLSTDTIQAEAVVICAGIHSIQLLKPLGIHLPLHIMHSYLGTSTLKTDEYAPNHVFIDETYRVAMTKLGNRIRISGLLSHLPYSPQTSQKAVKSLFRFAQDYFPNTINYDTLNVISRPYALTANGLPLLGTTPYNNLFINTSHGQNGWPAAIATAKLLTEHILGHNKTLDSPLLFSHFENK